MSAHAPSLGSMHSSAAAAVLGQRRLLLALGLSALLHLVVLSVHIVPMASEPAPRLSRSLDVVLVTARDTRPAPETDTHAQANLDRGGLAEHEARPSTPHPPRTPAPAPEAVASAPQAVASAPEPVAPAPEPPPPERRAATPAPAPAQHTVITRTGPDPDTRQAAPPRAPEPAAGAAPPAPPPTSVSGLDLMSSIASVARSEAHIDRVLNQQSARPRTQYIGARAREHRFAQYLEDWRLKVERVGALNYPESARGNVYGSLLLSVVIRADGSVERIEVQRSSGHPLLDDAAVRIVELAAPFAPFPPDIRVDTDIIDITRTWTFTNTNQLRTSR